MKKGFTLIELLGVIVLIAIIVGFALPAIMIAINSDKDKMDDALQNTIKASANLYVQDNPSKFKDKAVHYIKFSTLTSSDLLDASILTDYANYCVKTVYSYNQYNYEIVTSCVEG